MYPSNEFRELVDFLLTQNKVRQSLCPPPPTLSRDIHFEIILKGKKNEKANFKVSRSTLFNWIDEDDVQLQEMKGASNIVVREYEREGEPLNVFHNFENFIAHIKLIKPPTKTFEYGKSVYSQVQKIV